MPNEFGRRRPPEKPAYKPAVETTGETPQQEEESRLAEVLFSPLVGKIAGVVGVVAAGFVLYGAYVSNMKGMGRALNASWERKSVIQLEEGEPDLAKLSNRPCEVRSLSPSFREVQRQLGC